MERITSWLFSSGGAWTSLEAYPDGSETGTGLSSSTKGGSLGGDAGEYMGEYRLAIDDRVWPPQAGKAGWRGGPMLVNGRPVWRHTTNLTCWLAFDGANWRGQPEAHLGQRWLPSGLVNDEGDVVTGCQGTFYCGKHKGQGAIPGSDGRCGPNDGPACQSCSRLLQAFTMPEADLGQKSGFLQLPDAAALTPDASASTWLAKTGSGWAAQPQLKCIPCAAPPLSRVELEELPVKNFRGPCAACCKPLAPCCCVSADGEAIFCCVLTKPIYQLPACLHMALCPQLGCDPSGGLEDLDCMGKCLIALPILLNTSIVVCLQAEPENMNLEGEKNIALGSASEGFEPQPFAPLGSAPAPRAPRVLPPLSTPLPLTPAPPASLCSGSVAGTGGVATQLGTVAAAFFLCSCEPPSDQPQETCLPLMSGGAASAGVRLPAMHVPPPLSMRVLTW
jgi:hypothetical protein